MTDLHENFIKLKILENLPTNSPLFKYYCKPENFNKILDPVPLSGSTLNAQDENFSEIIMDPNISDFLKYEKLPDIEKIRNFSKIDDIISDESDTDSSFYKSSDDEKENHKPVTSVFREYQTLDPEDLNPRNNTNNNNHRVLKKRYKNLKKSGKYTHHQLDELATPDHNRSKKKFSASTFEIHELNEIENDNFDAQTTFTGIHQDDRISIRSKNSSKNFLTNKLSKLKNKISAFSSSHTIQRRENYSNPNHSMFVEKNFNYQNQDRPILAPGFKQISGNKKILSKSFQTLEDQERSKNSLFKRNDKKTSSFRHLTSIKKSPKRKHHKSHCEEPSPQVENNFRSLASKNTADLSTTLTFQNVNNSSFNYIPRTREEKVSSRTVDIKPKKIRKHVTNEKFSFGTLSSQDSSTLPTRHGTKTSGLSVTSAPVGMTMNNEEIFEPRSESNIRSVGTKNYLKQAIAEETSPYVNRYYSKSSKNTAV